ncbi:hypothetical protein THOM_2744 [Trachipleistophora hominis]|uniref:Uncharacterized protein n=1 Tax=Trachipleistophora hominis TaxID=72359 RepID=L7JTG3_TRAHO|nr:hypothetical protein THOM_2744 [Trachipleistophora hominis]
MNSLDRITHRNTNGPHGEQAIVSNSFEAHNKKIIEQDNKRARVETPKRKIEEVVAPTKTKKKKKADVRRTSQAAQRWNII